MSEEIRKNEPLPCPFCGAIPELWQAAQSGAYFIECTNETCGTNPMTNPSRYREGAVGKWNKRKCPGVFTRKELEGWLLEIAINNVDINDVFADHVQEIVNRLDGFERYCEDKREEEDEE